MKDTLTMSWNSLNEELDLIKILEQKRKTDTSIAGESSYTMTLYFSDGTIKRRWSWSDDPILRVWFRMREKAWGKADYSIPKILEYEKANFGNLERFKPIKMQNKSQ